MIIKLILLIEKYGKIHILYQFRKEIKYDNVGHYVDLNNSLHAYQITVFSI